MARYLTSLLVLVSFLLLPGRNFANEEVRRVQEELRKRHLFYANPTGEPSRALTTAIKRYQERKGFAPTGVIDSNTLSSLGIVRTATVAARTPVVVGYRGDVRGANGERLPSYPLFLWPTEDRHSPFDPATIGQGHVQLALAHPSRQGPPRHRAAGHHAGRIKGEDEAGTPFRIPFELSPERTGQALQKPIATRLGLRPLNNTDWELAELGATDEENVEQGAARSKGRSHRRTRRVKPRKEANPFILTYQSVDRALRSLFGDAQPKKKRSATRRL